MVTQLFIDSVLHCIMGEFTMMETCFHQCMVKSFLNLMMSSTICCTSIHDHRRLTWYRAWSCWWMLTSRVVGFHGELSPWLNLKDSHSTLVTAETNSPCALILVTFFYNIWDWTRLYDIQSSLDLFILFVLIIYNLVQLNGEIIIETLLF